MAQVIQSQNSLIGSGDEMKFFQCAPLSAAIGAVLSTLSLTAHANQLTVWTLPAVESDGLLTFETCAMHEGAVAASDVRLSIPFESAESLVDADTDGEFADGAVAWLLGNLAPGQSRCVVATASGVVGAPVVTGVAGGALHFEAARGPQPPVADAEDGAYGADFDRYAVAEVARLNGQVDEIVAFVRDEVRWVPYDGSLRGVRGTLWSREGNALDRAALLSEMLRIAGHPTRLSRGTLGDDGIDALLATLQPDWNRVASAPPDPETLVDDILALDGASEQLIALGYPPAPTALEGALLDRLYDRSVERARWASVVADHWWVETWDGGWTTLETLPVVTPSTDESAYEVPDAEKHSVHIELYAELYNPAFSPLGTAPDLVLDVTIPTDELVGHPATLWIESDVETSPGLVFISTERHYHPVLRAGGDVLATGETFSELLTNFPLASTFVFGVELELTLRAPDGSSETRSHVIVDRLGAAARAGYGDVSIAFDATADTSGLSGLDTVTISVGAGAPATSERARIRSELNQARRALENVVPRIDEIAESGGVIRDDADQLAVDTAVRLGLEANSTKGELIAARYLDESALFASQMAQEMLVRSWDAEPRVIVSGVRATDGGGAPFIDLLRHETEVWTPSNVPATAAAAFRLVRSEFEAELESNAIAALAPADAVLISLQTVWAAAQEAGIPIREFRPGDEPDVARLDLTADVQARIVDALGRGQNVFTPDRMVELEGVETIVWTELDPETGHHVAVGVNGWRMATVQYASLNRVLSKALGVWIGGLQGFTYGTLIGISQVLDSSLGKATASGAAGGVAKCGIGSISPGWGVAVAGWNSVESGDLDELGLLQALAEAAAGAYAPGVEQFISGYNTGFCIGALIGHMRVQMAVAGLQFADPPVPQSGAGALDPWRRPLWVAREPVDVAFGSVPEPALGGFAGIVGGTVAVLETDLSLAGALTVSGAGTVVVDGVPESTEGIGWTIDRWEGVIADGVLVGELAGSGGRVSVELDYGTGTSVGYARVRRVLDGGGHQWAELDSGVWTLTATGARGAASTGTIEGDDLVFIDGASAWYGVTAAIDIAEPSALVEFASTAGVRLEGIESVAARGVGERWSVTPQALVDGAGVSGLQWGVEAPRGWRVEPHDGGFDVWPRGAGPGTYVVQTWLEDGDGVVLGRQAAAVTLSEGGPALEVSLEYQPLYTIEVDGVPVPMVAQAVVRNAGSEPLDVSTSWVANDGFSVDAGWTAGLLQPGQDALTWVGVRPDGALPAPGARVELTLDATAEGATDAATISWTVPAVSGVAVDVDPLQDIGVPGASGTVSIDLEGLGNATGDIALVATNAADVTLDGIPESVAVTPGETTSLSVAWTLHETAKVGFAYGTVIEAFDGERFVGRAVVSILGVSAEMDKAYAAARSAAAIAADGPLVAELAALAELLAQFADGGCSGNALRELEYRLDRVAVSGDGLIPTLLIEELHAQADAIAESEYDCAAFDFAWLCTTLDQVRLALIEFDDALGPRLTLHDLSLPASVASGGDVLIGATLTNEDDEPSEATVVDVSVRQRGAATPVTTIAVPALAVGEEFPVEAVWSTGGVIGDFVVEVTGPRNELADIVSVVFAVPPDGNRAPVFGIELIDEVPVGESVSWPLDVSDPDGDAVFVNVVALPAGFSLSEDAIVGSARGEGELGFHLLATDPYGATTELAFVVNAAFVEANTPPLVTSIPPRLALVDVPWAYTPTALDFEGTEITFVLESSPDGVTFIDGVVAWTPGVSDIGFHWFDMTARDADGNETRHTFPVTVSAEPMGADLVVAELDVDWGSTGRGPFTADLSIVVLNGGDEATPATVLDVHPGNRGGEVLSAIEVPAIEAGESVSLAASIAGELAFEEQPIVVVVDSTDMVAEFDETNNVTSSAGAFAPTQWAYMAAPPTEAEVVLLAPDAETQFRVLDPDTRAVADAGRVPAGEPVVVDTVLRDGDDTFPLSQFLIETDGPVQAYVGFEIFEPDVGGDLFHPARDGSRIGREFVVYVPTASGNNGLFVTALAPLVLTRSDADGIAVESLELAAGQTWQVPGLTHGSVLQLSATGDIVVQSASVTGAVVVPPTSDSALAPSDVGREFVFSTRSRGLGGGALAVFAYEDTDYTVEVAEGTLLTGTLVAGEVGFHSGFGELRGARLLATGDVSVMSGDIARLGADRIGLIGEDLTQTIGRDGRSFVTHTLDNESVFPYLFAGPTPLTAVVNGETHSVRAFERLVLPADEVVEVSTSAASVLQTMGGGDRYFDYASVLPSLVRSSAQAEPVLSGATVDMDDCGTIIDFSVRIGNAGTAAIPGGSALRVELVRTDGVESHGPFPLDADLESGDWVDFAVSLPTTPSASVPSLVVRFEGSSFEPTSEAIVAAVAAPCLNRPPEIDSVPPTHVLVSELLRYTVHATDPDGESVRYDLVDGPSGTTLHPSTGRLQWGPSDAGVVVRFSVSASDDRGGVALQTFDVAVTDGSCTPDGDADGFCPPEDCNDEDPDVRPDAPEVPGDGLDNDCDPTTLDALPEGGVSLVLESEFDQVARGARVQLDASLAELTGRAEVDGITVEVHAICAGTTELVAELVGISLVPGGTESVPFAWDTAGVVAERCQLTATARLDDLILATDSVIISIEDGLAGEFTTDAGLQRQDEPLALDWRLTNVAETSVVAVAEVRRAGRSVPIARQDVELLPGDSADGSTSVDVSEWHQAPHRILLVSGVTLLDELVVPVLSPPVIEAIGAPDGRAYEWLDGADGVAVNYRPDGPTNGVHPAVVQVAWTPDVMLVGLTIDDSVEAVALEVFDETERRAEFSWTEEDGGAAVVEDTDRGKRIVWEVAPIDVAWAEDSKAFLFIDVATDLDRWWLSAAPTDGIEGAVPIEFLDAPQRPDPTPDVGTDVGVDAPSDVPSYDAEVGTDISDASEGTPGESGDAYQVREHDGGCNCRSSRGPAGTLWPLLVLLLAWRPRPRLGSRTPLAAVALGCGLAFAACGDRAPDVVFDVVEDGTPGTDAFSPDGGIDSDAGDGDARSDAAPETDVGRDADSGEPDSDTRSDLSPPDSGSWPDGSVPPSAGTGDECETDEDCVSGICQEAVDFSVCTEMCLEGTCPDGFSCEPFPGGVSVCIAVAICIDADEDGYGRGSGCAGADCDDADPLTASGLAEVCDGVDNDCDGDIDEGVTNACGGCGEAPTERCNGFDDDCDGEVDEGVTNACGTCTALPEEICNGEDDDCDGTPDEGVCLECDLGESRSCYSPDEDTEGVGLCIAGEQRCETSGWSACVGAVFPAEELCDGADNDCDGETDEGLLNACGTCGAAPLELCDGIDNDCDGDADEGVLSPCGACTPCGEARVFPFERGDAEPSIAPAPDGAITLGTGLLERHDIWVPNSDESTVSRFDTRTGRELGRYWIGVSPSRTAVDLDGNVWIGNRGDGIVTHIFGDPDRCIDRNGDGVIQTSRDLNGDGIITGGEILPEADGDALADECVHCQVRVGTVNDLVRGVGVDAENHAWVGTWYSRELYEIDPETCEVRTQISTGVGGGTVNASNVYGIAIDPDGYLWTSGFTSNCMPQVDTRTGETVNVICDGRTRYGLAVAPDGTLWFGGYNDNIYSYTPSTGEWATFSPPEGGLSEATGIVVDGDGMVYVAGYRSNNVGRFDPATGTWVLFPTNAPPDGFGSYNNPRGVTIDAEGELWVISRTTSGLIEMTRDGEWVGDYPIVRASNPAAGTGPYSYSDNTGFQLFNIVAREGIWRDVIDAGAPVRFLELETVTHEPSPSSIDLRYRFAAASDELVDAEWSEWTPAAGIIDLRAAAPETARLIEVSVRLQTDDPEIRPVLRSLNVRYETADCREAIGGCPFGQICEPVYGGCIVPPTECSRDAECDPAEYCDDTGGCRIGCRLDADSCEGGLTCDPESHRCLFRTFECGTDADCAAGSYCTDGRYCEDGCRVTVDDCPIGFRCEASSRVCEATPPECVLDDDCSDAQYCGDGRCIPGCRLDGTGCDVGEVCAHSTRLCVPAPPACDPEAITDELCNGLDDDCDGVIDNAPVDEGTTCEIGAYLMGELTCTDGALLCRHDGRPLPVGTPLDVYASDALDFSSQRYGTVYSAGDALGIEDVSGCRVDGRAWSPSPDGAEPEFLHVGFAVPIDATALRIRESWLGGFVTAVDVGLVDGTLVEDAWTGPDDTACGEWLEIPLEFDQPVVSARIHTAVDGREQIDAVSIVGSTATESSPLLGPLTDVWLGGMNYEVVPENLTVTGAFRIDDGAALSRDGHPWVLSRNGSGNGTIGAVDFDNASFDWRGFGGLIIEGALFTADPSAARTGYISSNTARLDRVTVTDVPFSTGFATSLVVVSGRHTVSDRNVWVWATAGPAEFVHTELVGPNTIPRRADGLYATGPLTVRDSSIERFQYGLEIRSSADAQLIDSTLADSDQALRVSASGRARLDGVTIDLSDPGHVGDGVHMAYTNLASALFFDDVTIRATPLDTPLALDIDVFNDANDTSWGTVTIDGVDADESVALQGNVSAGTIRIDALPFTSRFLVRDNIWVAGDVDLVVGGVGFWRWENTRTSLSLSSGATASFDGTTFENVGLVQEASAGTLDVSNSSFTMEHTGHQQLVTARGVATVTGTHIESLGTVSDERSRIHTGLWTQLSSDVTVTDSVFRGLRYGVYSEDTAQIDISASTFDGCQRGISLKEGAVATVTDVSISENSSLLASFGLDCRFDPGGRVDVDGLALDLGAEDIGISLEPDTFSAASGSTFADVAFGEDLGTRVGLRGDGLATDIAFSPVGGESTLFVYETTRILEPAVATFSGPVTLESHPDWLREFHVGAGATLVSTDGVTFLDVGLRNWGTVDATGTRFEGTGRTSSQVLECAAGTVTLTDSTVIGNESRRQDGVRVNGGNFSATDTVFTDLDECVYSQGETTVDIVRGDFENCRIGFSGRYAFDAALTECRFIGGDELHMTGAYFQDPADGLSLVMTDAYVDLDAEHNAFTIPIEGLLAGRTLTFSGTSFGPRGPGQGYIVYGINDAGHVDLGLLEPAQPGWRLYANVTVNEGGTLSIPAGVTLASDGIPRALTLNNGTDVVIDGARLEDIQLQFNGTATADIDDTEFVGISSGRRYLNYLTGSGVITIDDCTYRGEATSTDTRGITTTVDATNVTITNGVFEALNYGVVASSTPPNLISPTFIDCGTDTFGFD